MYRCLVLHAPGLLPSGLLLKFIGRTGCLELVWAGAYADLSLARQQAADWDLVFASLPAPDQLLPADYWHLLQQQKALVLTSPFPAKLFVWAGWHPVAFLTEPFSFAQFQQALQLYLDTVQ